MVTFSIYYFVWYVKINKDVASLSGDKILVGTGGLWFSQMVPIASWISLANSSSRLTQVQASHDLPVASTGGMMILSSFWFGSHIRYLQRRVNRTIEALETPSQSTVAQRSPTPLAPTAEAAG